MSTSLSELVANMSGKCTSLECGKSYVGNSRCKEHKKLMEGLIKKFPSVYQFCDGDINRFILLLQKGLYLYEYMDSWERFNETSLPDKKYFYSDLNLEDIIDKDYLHV